MIIPNIWEDKKWQPNHQPAGYIDGKNWSRAEQTRWPKRATSASSAHQIRRAWPGPSHDAVVASSPRRVFQPKLPAEGPICQSPNRGTLGPTHGDLPLYPLYWGCLLQFTISTDKNEFGDLPL